MKPSASAFATRILEALRSGTQIAPISFADRSFDVPAAYEVLAQLHEARRREGWRPVGRKVGFTNRTILERYGVDRPMWSHVWDSTVTFARDGVASLSLEALLEPRLEPEVVFKLGGPLPPGNDPVELLRSIEWLAAGFEFVQSIFPGWRFGAPDCTAAFGLHGALVVGTPVEVNEGNRARLAMMLPHFEATLRRGEQVIDTGVGANVLGSPLNALAHLRDVLAAQPDFPPLAAGEIVTTGTLTDAWPVKRGETWSSDYGSLGVRGVTLTFR
jgi:2-oxo-3-hexenedioate decarboxylase